MKNIFIGGVAKSGKSRLAVDLCTKYKYNHIPIDYFTSSFKRNFPDVGIKSNVVIDKESSKLLSLFLSRVIEIIEYQNEEYFIIDSAHVLPEDIIKYLNPDKWDIYYLGYPNITANDKIDEIKKYVKDSWLDKRTDSENLKIFEDLIGLSCNIEKECKKYNIKFIDTSNNDVIGLFDIYNKDY